MLCVLHSCSLMGATGVAVGFCEQLVQQLQCAAAWLTGGCGRAWVGCCSWDACVEGYGDGC
jgi:hypothetical protein